MEYKDLHIAGLIRLHRFEDEIELVLNSLSAMCDKVYVLTNDVKSKRMLDALNALPNLGTIKECSVPWTQRGSMDEAMRMLDIVQPDAVLFPDEDEVLPAQLPSEIAQWIPVWGKHPTMAVPFVHCIGDANTILAEKLDRHGLHCKVLRWTRDITYLNGYAGWCWPNALYKQKKYRCRYPLRHMAYMTQAQRDERKKSKRNLFPWCLKKTFPTMAYDPDMTWKEWNGIAGPYLVELSLAEVRKIDTVFELCRRLHVFRHVEQVHMKIKQKLLWVADKLVTSAQNPLPEFKVGDEISVYCRERSARLRITR